MNHFPDPSAHSFLSCSSGLFCSFFPNGYRIRGRPYTRGAGTAATGPGRARHPQVAIRLNRLLPRRKCVPDTHCYSCCVTLVVTCAVPMPPYTRRHCHFSMNTCVLHLFQELLCANNIAVDSFPDHKQTHSSRTSSTTSLLSTMLKSACGFRKMVCWCSLLESSLVPLR
jgi:hypothetical protein